MEFQVAKGVPFVMDDFLTEGKANSSGLLRDYFSSGDACSSDVFRRFRKRPIEVCHERDESNKEIGLKDRTEALKSLRFHYRLKINVL